MPRKTPETRTTPKVIKNKAAKAAAKKKPAPAPKRKPTTSRAPKRAARPSQATVVEGASSSRRGGARSTSSSTRGQGVAGNAGEEKRAARFVRSPSIALCDRIDRALSQRLYLLQLQRHPAGPGAEFKVLGSTGNVYTVDIGSHPCCDCPDFLKGRGLCKHILFVWLRVLGISEDDYRIWQRALISSELRSAVEPLFKRRARRALPLARQEVQKAFEKATKQEEDEDQERRHRKVLEGEDCPVCFEEMCQAEETAGKLTFCCACGNNFHRDCIRRWQQASSGSCPLCREPWHPVSKHVAPGDCLPAIQKLQSMMRSDSFHGMSYLNLME